MINSTEFKVIQGGPLHVKGNFIITDSSGIVFDIKDEALLCRCGHSKNKPFCDGSHHRKI
jgi:CDGSH iron-sulfur domain-containing protein 3